MSKATLTIEGFVAKDPELKYHEGRPVTNVTVAHTPRRLDKATNEWVDAGPTLWVQASFWEQNAESIVATVSKGTLVTITGQPEVRVFTKQDGSAEANLNLKFGTLGVIPRTPTKQTAEPWSTPGSQTDAWPTPGSFGDDTPF
jgi:single-strand DNA-binding protein